MYLNYVSWTDEQSICKHLIDNFIEPSNSYLNFIYSSNFVYLCVYTYFKKLNQIKVRIRSNSIYFGKFSNTWKQVLISPIYKSGDQNNITNITENNVLDQLFPLVQTVISQNPTGFFRKLSFKTNLLECANFILITISSKNRIDSITTGFSKAFDKISNKEAVKDID